LERQTAKIDKITSILQALLKETNLQLQVKKLQNQVTEIHKSKSKIFPIKTTARRKIQTLGN
jgi:hypothetical protein